jgi:hypothetical protein
MPTFSVSGTTAAIGTAAAYVTLGTTANRRALVREIGMFAGTAVACFVAEGIPANTPVATTTLVPVAHDAADAASTATLGTAWSTAPTVATVFRRQTVLGAAVGAGTIWKLALDERIIIAKSAFDMLWNNGGSTSAPLSVYFEYDE